MNPKQHGFHSGRSYKILEKLEKSHNVDVVYLGFARAFDNVYQGILLNKLKKSQLMVKSVSGYTIFYKIDNNVLPSMKQHQVKLKSEVAYPVFGPLIFLIYISDINCEIVD